MWDGLTIEDDVFTGPNVTFLNDLYPKSKIQLESFFMAVIKKGESIGANATIFLGITLGQNCLVGTGSVVTKNVSANADIAENPARILRYID